MNRRKIPLGLYGITAENFSNGKSNVDVVKEMINSGIKIIQYREKYKSMKEKVLEAIEISKICKENGVLFIVNDHVDIAIIANADGVHVGQDDIPVSIIRKLIGNDKIIGLSTHSPEEAKKALGEDIDYIGVGPLFPTTTKDRKAVGLQYLEYVQNNINIPYVAIGGIKENNLYDVISLGATRICLVSDIVGSNNIREKIDKLNSIIEGGNK